MCSSILIPDKKLLWVEPSHFRLGDSLHYMADIEVSKQLARKHINTFLILPRSKKCLSMKIGTSRVQTVSLPIKHIPLLSSIFYAIALVFYLPIFIIKNKPNFIMTVPDVSILSFLPIVLLAKLKHSKLILDIRSVPVETFGFVGFLQKFWFALSVHVAKNTFDGLTVITPLMRLDISNQYGINVKKIGVWTSGVSEDIFTNKNESQSAKIRNQYSLSNKFVVFYHGVFTASRGLKETIKSIKILKEKNYNVVFFLLGEGSALTTLVDCIRDNHLEKEVIIHPRVEYNDVPTYIQMSDVCIVPLPNSPFWNSQSPLKLLEYLSMEKVVILTDIPAHKLVVGNKKCGIYISSVTPLEIANSIIYAFNNKDKLVEWGKIGRKIIFDGYTWERVAENLAMYLATIEKNQ